MISRRICQDYVTEPTYIWIPKLKSKCKKRLSFLCVLSLEWDSFIQFWCDDNSFDRFFIRMIAEAAGLLITCHAFHTWKWIEEKRIKIKLLKFLRIFGKKNEKTYFVWWRIVCATAWAWLAVVLKVIFFCILFTATAFIIGDIIL